MSLAQATWRALGMTVVVALADRGGLDRARRIVEEELAAADAAYSPVRRDTELVRVEAAGGAPVPVGDCLLGAIEVALRAARATDGLVDPAVGAALTLAEAEPRADADADLERGPRRLRARRTPGWQAVAADRATATASVPRGVRLDLGATGKALIADRAAARIATGGPGALVGVGGDLATAGASPPGGWLVRVTDDSRAIEGGELVRLDSGALATSSTTVRRRADGAVHIVDPRDRAGAAGPWRTASVAAATCVDANAASTAAILLGAAAPTWLRAAALPARLVARDGTTLHVAGWPAAEGSEAAAG